MKKIISEDELIEYSLCPFKHLYKYVYKVSAVGVDSVDLRLHAIRQTILWMYSEYSKGVALTLESVFSKLETELEQIASTVGIDKQLLSIQIALGRNTLKKWYDELPEYSVLGILMPWKKEINTIGNQMIITGVVDLIRVKNDKDPTNRVIQAINLVTNRRYFPSEMEKTNAIDMVCVRLGMYTLGSQMQKKYNRRVALIWACLYTDKSANVDITPELVKTSTGWLSAIALAINNRIYFPQYQKYKCELCPYEPGCNPTHAGFDSLHNKSRTKNFVEKQIEKDSL
jgi:hypothetical protein